MLKIFLLLAIIGIGNVESASASDDVASSVDEVATEATEELPPPPQVETEVEAPEPERVELEPPVKTKTPEQQVGEALEQEFKRGATGQNNRKVEVVQGQILLKLPVNIKMAGLDLNIEGMDIGGIPRFEDDARYAAREVPSNIEEGSANTLHLMPTRFAVNIVLVSALLFSLYCIKQMVDVCFQKPKIQQAL